MTDAQQLAGWVSDKPEMLASPTPAQHTKQKTLTNSESGSVNVGEGSAEVGRCGFGRWTPGCLQPLARPWVYLLTISALAFTQSLLVAGYSNSILTSIEKRYNLWSRQLGVIAGTYDITCMISVIVVSYLGDRYNRAAWLGRGALIMAIGAAIFTIPHFTGGRYSVTSGGNVTDGGSGSLCGSGGGGDDLLVCDEEDSDTWAFVSFLVAQLVIGVGAAPVYTLGPTYLYDNTSPRRYPIYAAVMYSMVALGPAAGFLMGAMFLSMYVEPDAQPDGLTSNSPFWVGAWWLGFFVCAGLALLVALPLMMFPKKLPPAGKKEEASESGSPHRPTDDTVIIGAKIKDFPRQLKSQLTNATWWSISLALVAEQSITTAFVTFISKYFQLAFRFSASRANIITGVVVIPGAFLGILTGGGIMRRYPMEAASIARLLFFLNFVPTAGIVSLILLPCPTTDLVGVNVPYSHLSQDGDGWTAVLPLDMSDLTGGCDSSGSGGDGGSDGGCGCSPSTYEPVCGTDLLTYPTACHAGCTTLLSSQPSRNYSSCACIGRTVNGSVSGGAISGRCDHGCDTFVTFLILLFLTVFFTCCGQNPALIITLRSAKSEARSFALGLQTVLVRLLASIPAPIYFGLVFDGECMLWSSKCSGDGACLEYDVHHLARSLFGTILAIKATTFLFLALTYISENYRSCQSHYDVTSPPSLATTSTATLSESSVSTVTGLYSRYRDSTAQGQAACNGPAL